MAIGLDKMHHEGTGEVVWSGCRERWWWWSWVGQQVCGPGSCGEESGLPRLGSLAGASCPQWMCLARFLLLGTASEWWQAAAGAGDERSVRLCRRARVKLTKHLFFASSCYIRCYLAACLCLLFAWAPLAASTRGFSPPSPTLTQLIIFQLMPPPRAADLRKPNSDSCRYEPLVRTCTPSQPPPPLSSGIAYHHSNLLPQAHPPHAISPRLAKAHPNSDHPARLRGFMLQARHRPRRGRWWGGMS